MKKQLRNVTIFVAVTVATSIFAQGSLTPPGAPAATMKTLDQVEPRTPIGSIPYTISEPGSYYLSSTLTLSGAGDGITIAADNVTLDLMGFTLKGGGGSGIVGQSGRQYLAIRNGSVHGWGLDGIQLQGVSNSVLRSLVCTANGRDGLVAGSNALVSDCIAAQNGDDGISVSGGIVSECTVKDNGANGIDAGVGSIVIRCAANENGANGILTAAGSTVSECTARDNAGNGITSGEGCTIKGCSVSDGDSHGISAGNNSTVRNCKATKNLGDGIRVEWGNLVTDCNASGQTNLGNSVGIHATGASNRIDENTVMNNDCGIRTVHTNYGSLIVNNSASDNGTDYDIPPENNLTGPIRTSPGGLDHEPWENLQF